MNTSIKDKQSARQTWPRGILIAAILMILFGIAEVRTGFTHNFVGLITSQGNIATDWGVILGTFYSLAGVLILTRRKWAAALAIALLRGDVIGRIGMVLTGLYPLNSFLQTFSIVVGTVIAAFFAFYIGLKWKFFK